MYYTYIPPAHFLSLRGSVTATITAKMSPVIKRETPAAISPILEPLSDSEEEADILIHCECNVHGYTACTFTTIGAHIRRTVCTC